MSQQPIKDIIKPTAKLTGIETKPPHTTPPSLKNSTRLFSLPDPHTPYEINLDKLFPKEVTIEGKERIEISTKLKKNLKCWSIEEKCGRFQYKKRIYVLKDIGKLRIEFGRQLMYEKDVAENVPIPPEDTTGNPRKQQFSIDVYFEPTNKLYKKKFKKIIPIQLVSRKLGNQVPFTIGDWINNQFECVRNVYESTKTQAFPIVDINKIHHPMPITRINNAFWFFDCLPIGNNFIYSKITGHKDSLYTSVYEHEGNEYAEDFLLEDIPDVFSIPYCIFDSNTQLKNLGAIWDKHDGLCNIVNKSVHGELQKFWENQKEELWTLRFQTFIVAVDKNNDSLEILGRVEWGLQGINSSTTTKESISNIRVFDDQETTNELGEMTKIWNKLRINNLPKHQKLTSKMSSMNFDDELESKESETSTKTATGTDLVNID